MSNRERTDVMSKTRLNTGPSFWRALGFCICSALIVAVGCKKKGADSASAPSGLIIAENGKSIPDMLPEDVIVSVNGVTLTRQKFDEMLDRMADSYRASNPSGTQLDVKSYRQYKSQFLIGDFVSKQILLQEAKRRGLKPAPQHLAAMEDLLAKRAKRDGKTTEEFLRSLGPAAEEIRNDVAEQALILTLRQEEFGDRLQITEADLNKEKDRVEKYNRMCEQTNAVVMAKAIAICKRLRSGEDFFAVAEEESQDTVSVKGVWGEFVRGEIKNAQLRHAAFTLPVGAVSDPIDTDDGLVIIKVLERAGIDATVASVAATVKLGRILLQNGELEQVKNDKVLRKELESKRLGELQKDWLAALRNKMRLEYPNGTNFWKKAAKR